MGKNGIAANGKIPGRTGRTEEKSAGRQDQNSASAAGAKSGPESKQQQQPAAATELLGLADGLIQADPKPAAVAVPVPEEPKRGPGRPPGSGKKSSKNTQPSQPADPQMEQNLKFLVLSVFDLLSIPFGPVWKLQPAEADLITGPGARLAERYGLTELGGKYLDWFMLISALSAITVPRVMLTREMKKHRKEGELINANQPANTQGAAIKATGDRKGHAAGNGPDNVRQLLPGLA